MEKILTKYELEITPFLGWVEQMKIDEECKSQ